MQFSIVNFLAETLNNGSLSLSPPHAISQRESLQIMQPASAPGSPPSSPCISPVAPAGTLDPNWQASKPTVSIHFESQEKKEQI